MTQVERTIGQDSVDANLGSLRRIFLGSTFSGSGSVMGRLYHPFDSQARSHAFNILANGSESASRRSSPTSIGASEGIHLSPLLFHDVRYQEANTD